eukprot:1161128-Pelagomonas_calceolata.AAC.5
MATYLTAIHHVQSFYMLGAATSGQNSRGAVKKGQAASADQDSQARARKIAQAIKSTWGPPRRYGISRGYVGPPSYGNVPPFSGFHLKVISGGDPVADVIQASYCAYGRGNMRLPSSECQTLLNILVDMKHCMGIKMRSDMLINLHSSTLFIKCSECI